MSFPDAKRYFTSIALFNHTTFTLVVAAAALAKADGSVAAKQPLILLQCGPLWLSVIHIHTHAFSGLVEHFWSTGHAKRHPLDTFAAKWCTECTVDQKSP